MTRPALETRLIAAWPPENWATGTVVVAVSGGADSVALLRALHAVRPGSSGKLCVAHFNHRLRGAAADADERFVAELAAQLGLPIEIGRASNAPDPETTASEEVTRADRYTFLQAVGEQLGARYVAVAHTADDQVETVLHRILRGTGIAGLAGISRARPLGGAVALIRPLLAFRRAELREYLHEIRQPFREDASNAASFYTRNRLRNELLPHLAAQYNDHVDEALLRLSRLAGEAQDVLDGLVRDLADGCATHSRGSISFDVRILERQPPYLVREIMRHAWREQDWPEQPMGFAEWTALAEMVRREEKSPDAGRQIPIVRQRDFPGGVRAVRTANQLRLTRS